MGKNTEEIKARRELWKAYIDRGIEPENLNDERILSVYYYADKEGESTIGEEAKNIKEAARLVQKFVHKADVYTKIIVREKHDRLLSIELIDGFWKFKYWI